MYKYVLIKYFCICSRFDDLLQYGSAPFVLKKDLVCPSPSKESFHATTLYPGPDPDEVGQTFKELN